MYDYWVHAVGMDAVEYIEVEWQDCEHFVGKFLSETSSCRIQSEVPNLRIQTEHQNTNKYQPTIPSFDCESCNYRPQVARESRRILSDCQMVQASGMGLDLRAHLHSG
jgi:hypothetical protein